MINDTYIEYLIRVGMIVKVVPSTMLSKGESKYFENITLKHFLLTIKSGWWGTGFIIVVEHMFYIYEPLHTVTITQIQTLHVAKSFLSHLLPNNNFHSVSKAIKAYKELSTS